MAVEATYIFHAFRPINDKYNVKITYFLKIQLEF